MDQAEQAEIITWGDVKMLSTTELEKYIKKEILDRLGEVNWRDINFKEGNENGLEGTYIFNQNNEYHILYTEKGKVKEDSVTFEKEEVLWRIVEIISFDTAMKYAIENKEEGKDFRRALFKKEIEIYSLFGEKFEKKKRIEIEEILKKSPYNDI